MIALKSKTWILLTALVALSPFIPGASAAGTTESFDGGFSNFTATGLWHVTTQKAYSGTTSAWYGQEATGDYDVGAVSHTGSLTSPAFKVPTNGQLTFKSWHGIDGAWWYPESTIVEVNRGGDEW